MTELTQKNDIRGRRRQAILDAAAEEFYHSGFEHARMDAIAVRAGIGKSTIYEYFPSKTALLAAVSEQMAERVFGEFCAILHTDQPFRSKMVGYVRFLTSVMAQTGGKLMQIFRENDSLEFIDEIGQRYVKRQYELLEQEIVRAQQSGELRGDIEPDVAALVLSSLPAARFKVREVPAEAVVDLLMRGMGV